MLQVVLGIICILEKKERHGNSGKDTKQPENLKLKMFELAKSVCKLLWMYFVTVSEKSYYISNPQEIEPFLYCGDFCVLPKSFDFSRIIAQNTFIKSSFQELLHKTQLSRMIAQNLIIKLSFQLIK